MRTSRFIPVFEPLEGKLLLTVLPMLPAGDMQHRMAIENAASEVHIESIKLSMEHYDDASYLLVQLGEGQFEETCLVCIVGGDLALTSSQGTARLRLPHDAQSVDLTIHDNRGVVLGSVQLEFDAGGKIVRETWSGSDVKEADRANYIVAPNHSDALHTMTLLALPMDVTDHAHDLVAGANSQGNAAEVDAALAHHYMTPTSTLRDPSMPATGHFSRSNHEPSAAEEFDRPEGSIAHAVEMLPDSAPAELGLVSAEVPVEDDVDFILANWTADEKLEQAEPLPDTQAEVAVAKDSALPIPHPSVPMISEESNPPLEVAYAVYFASMPSAVSTDEPSEPTQWPMLGGLVVSVIAAGAALALDRKAGREVQRDDPSLP